MKTEPLTVDRVIEILNNIYEESPENVALVFQILKEDDVQCHNPEKRN